MSRPHTVVVGTGAVGASLIAALAAAEYPIGAIVSRSKKRAERVAFEASCQTVLTLGERLPTQATLVFLAVPDDVIAETADLLANTSSWQDVTVAHTSGALDHTTLTPLASAGARTMSFHPMQSFSPSDQTSMEGIYIGIEGMESAIPLGFEIAKNLGAHPVQIHTEDKKAYHLSASIASNLLVVLTQMACDVLTPLGFSRSEAVAILGPLIRQTADNVSRKLPEQALTGPAARGDISTLRVHFETLQAQFPHYLEIYQSLTSEALKLAVKGGRLSSKRAKQIKKELFDLSKNNV